MVYVFLANGFEEIEALTPVDLMRRAGIEVVTVGVTGEYVTGRSKITVKADIDEKTAQKRLEGIADIEMLVLPGGMPGADNLDKSPLVDAYIEKAVSDGAYIAAICAAPMILGVRGLLRGVRCVCYPGFEKYLDGAVLQPDGITVMPDGRFITARGAGTAVEFALAAIRALRGGGSADAVREGIIA